MKIGFIGLGKLGLPVAAAIAYRGFDVVGYDIDIDRHKLDVSKFTEAGYRSDTFGQIVNNPLLEFGSLKEACNADLIFVAVQTPHAEAFNGETLLKDTPKDFNYDFVVKALTDIEGALDKPTPVAVVSTMLPGSFANIAAGLKPDTLIELVYNPLFIAMGTAVHDFLEPEFVVIGKRHPAATATLGDFYYILFKHSFAGRVRIMSPESAELAKCAYNTFISQKITFANTLMEMCHYIPGANVDDVTQTLQRATDRLVSPRYMTAGMGDGGGCHPRENVALSYLSSRLNLSYSPFKQMIGAREKQAEFLANILTEYSFTHNLAIMILGYAFKPESNISTGSSALLVMDILQGEGEEVFMLDPYIDRAIMPGFPYVFLIGCKHARFAQYTFPKGSVVIDPHRYIPDQEGVEFVRIGQ